MPRKGFEPDITLSEEGGVRYLHFGSPWVQGAMRLNKPHDIVIDYVALMQSWLLFLRPPERLLQLGLGAGALTKHCLARLPETEMDVVEKSKAVVRAAQAYFEVPRKHPRLTIHTADGAEYLTQQQAQPFGVIQVDVYDQEAKGPVLSSADFYESCFRNLASPGILVVNLFGQAQSYGPNLQRIEDAFDGRVLAWPPVDAGNVVLLGFKGPRLQVSLQQLQTRAKVLQSYYALPALKWLAALRKSTGFTTAQGSLKTTYLQV